MDRALEVQQAKLRLRRAADRLGEQAAWGLWAWAPRRTLQVSAAAAVVGLILGRRSRLFGLLRQALPALLRAASAVEPQIDADDESLLED